VKILNQALANRSVHFLGLVLEFDADGHAHLESDEHALELANIPGYEIVNEQLDAAVTKAKGPGKSARSKKDKDESTDGPVLAATTPQTAPTEGFVVNGAVVQPSATPAPTDAAADASTDTDPAAPAPLKE
jgi:hypothetical protein